MQLLFVHGAGGSGLSFHYQVQAFPGADAVGLPGHPVGKPATSIEGYTEWVRGYVAGKEYRDVLLVGHSMGGAIAMTYALRYPEELRAVVLMGTGARLRVLPETLKLCQDGIQDPEPWLKQRALAYEKVAPAVRLRILERARQVGPAVTLNDFLCCDKFDALGEVAQVRLPTLIISGTEDAQTPPKYHDYLEARIQGSRRAVIPGGTHQAHLEYPQQVNGAIRDFLASLEAG